MRFTKMQGAGNDFVMLDATQEPFTLTTEQIRALCDRRYGVGCDQLLVVEKSALPEVDFKYRIFNCSGGEVEMCGNGARCFAVFVRELGLTDKTTIACGSGACAAVTSGIRRGFLGNDVLVHMRGGDIRVRWSGESEASVYLSGPAVTVFTGEIDLDRIVLPTANF